MYRIKMIQFCLVNGIKRETPNKETIKNVLADFRADVPNFEANPRDFTFEEFGNGF